MADFDHYHRWLGIPSAEQPPNYYRLLGLAEFESDEEVIQDAADRQTSHIKRYASGPHRDIANELLNELATAHLTLLDPTAREEYDRPLKRARKKRRDEEKRKKDEEDRERIEAESQKVREFEALQRNEADARISQEFERERQRQDKKRELARRKATAESSKPTPVYEPIDRDFVVAVADEKRTNNLLLPLLIAGAIGISAVIGGVVFVLSIGAGKSGGELVDAQPVNPIARSIDTTSPSQSLEDSESNFSEEVRVSNDTANSEIPSVSIKSPGAQEISELASHRLRIETTRSLLAGEVFELVGEKVQGVSLSKDGWLYWVPSEQQSDVDYEIGVAIKKGSAVLASSTIKYYVAEVDAPSFVVGSTDEFSLFAGETKTEYLMFFDSDSQFENHLEVAASQNVDVEILQVEQASVSDEIRKRLSAQIFQSSAMNPTLEDSTIFQLVFRAPVDIGESDLELTITDEKTKEQFGFPLAISPPYQVLGRHDSFISEVFSKGDRLGAFSEAGVFTYWKDSKLVAKIDSPSALYAPKGQFRRWSVFEGDKDDGRVVVWSPGRGESIGRAKSAKFVVNTVTDESGKLVDKKFMPLPFKKNGLDWNSEHDYLIDGSKIEYIGANRLGGKKLKAAKNHVRFVDGTMTTFTGNGELHIWSGFKVDAENRNVKLSSSLVRLPGVSGIERVIQRGDFFCCLASRIEREGEKSHWRKLSVFENDNPPTLRKELEIPIHDATFWKEFLVVATKVSKLRFIDAESFETLYELDLPAPVTALGIDSETGQLIAGDAEGAIIRFADGLDQLFISEGQ